ncbi:hypothetical protein HDU76_012259, partial [Blyttiomyces sp. JEL0837]
PKSTLRISDIKTLIRGSRSLRAVPSRTNRKDVGQTAPRRPSSTQALPSRNSNSISTTIS